MKRAGEFDDPLTYSVPKELELNCKIGMGVYVPLRGKLVQGIIVDIKLHAPDGMDDGKIKPVEKLSGLDLGARQTGLAKQIADYYRTSLTRSLRLMIPEAVWKGKVSEPKEVYYSLSGLEAKVRGTKQKAVTGALSGSKTMSQSELGVSSATIRSLLESGVIKKEERAIYGSFDADIFPLKPLKFTLTDKQSEALTEIESAEKPVLIHGITGSGKTELYLRVILDAVKKGKQAILLVPEIALTPQMIDYFKDYFGEHIALFHSKLSEGEKAVEWYKVKVGHACLVIGSRSAIFAPAKDLGVVILDEEHEWTYKQESSPYYQAHHVGEMLADIWGCELIMGSATPRLESFYKAKNGDYKYLRMAERVNKKELPEISIVDLRDEFKQKNYSILSRRLHRKIQEKLLAKEQIILFVNQRGMASSVVCRDCGHTEECPHCEVSLKYHRQSGRAKEALLCHYCGLIKPMPLTCPDCASSHIRYIGVGTERVEDEVKKLFPEARVIRADKDTTGGKEGFSPIYRSFKNGDYDILIGTQMVAKGLDFERVTLIGIILADIGLHIPDFRSHERLFQLITQVSGRCGRGSERGEVVLQTYQPEHFAIQKAAGYDYDDFIETELGYRKKLGYPPFGRIIKFTVVGLDQEKLRKHIEVEQQALEDIFKICNLKFKIVSAPAMVPKIADRYYYHVLIRADDPHVIFDHWKPPKHWRVDVDPIHTA